ncbi:MAG: DUF2281 domain-containing protein [Defluviitaleaceae bacterium]|nr:DUF2281 domain-containing protein [Defluviitaleaceae bacterium]
MATANISVTIDSDLRDKAQAVFDALGIDMATAISMLLRKELYSQEAPLITSVKPSTSAKKDRRGAFGYLKGKIHVPDDFNEPLDDFREYMQ